MNARRSQSSGPLTCVAVLVFVRAVLAIAGYSKTRRLIERLSAVSAGVSWAHEDFAHAEALSLRICRCAVFLPSRAVCLEQSLALYLLLRRQGMCPEIRLGVRPLPFSAHAWVELNGVPVNEDLGFTRTFVTVSRGAR